MEPAYWLILASSREFQGRMSSDQAWPYALNALQAWEKREDAISAKLEARQRSANLLSKPADQPLRRFRRTVIYFILVSHQIY